MRGLILLLTVCSFAVHAADDDTFTAPPIVTVPLEPPAEPAPAVAIEAPHPSSTPPAAEVVVERPTFDFAVGEHSFSRTFGPTDGARFLASYAGSAGGVGVEAHWFPAAPVSPGFLGNLGLFGEGAFSVGLISRYTTQEFASNAALLRGGVMLRVPLGRAALNVSAGVAYQGFEIGQLSTTQLKRPPIPDVAFLGPRAGVGVLVALVKTVSLEGALGFTYALSSGELATAILSSTALGLDAKVGLRWAVLPNLQLRVSGDWARTFVQNASHAAADQYLGFTGSLAFSM